MKARKFVTILIAGLVALSSQSFLLGGFPKQIPTGSSALSFDPTASSVCELTQGLKGNAVGPLSTISGRPLSFEANRGQAPSSVDFLSINAGYALTFCDGDATISLGWTRQKPPHAGGGRKGFADSELPDESQGGEAARLRIGLLGARNHPRADLVDPLPGRANYLVGDDPTRWITEVAMFAKLIYREVYPGIDVAYYGRESQLEYDYILAPGAKPEAIRLEFVGSSDLNLRPSGELVIDTPLGQIVQPPPTIYQEESGSRVTVPGQYVITGDRHVSFDVGHYDQTRPLVIDPIMDYSTLLGPGAAVSAAIDSEGSVYVTGATYINVLSDAGLFPGTTRGGDAFVAKIRPDGALIYATFIGGSSGEGGGAIAIDAAGNAFVAGQTSSYDFPTTPGAFQPAFGGGSSNFAEVFVVKLNATGSGLIYSSYLGGIYDDQLGAMALDPSGNIYVTGTTRSPNFPLASPTDNTLGGFEDAFVTKVNHDGTELIYSTYLGGAGGDQGHGVAADSVGNVYLTGFTGGSFPVTQGSYKTSGFAEAFVTKLGQSGQIIYSTYLGGAGDTDEGLAIVVDSAGKAYVAGRTWSTDFPTTSGAAQKRKGGGPYDSFTSVINAAGSELLYSTYVGGNDIDLVHGIALDNNNNPIIVGETLSSDLPTTRNALMRSYGGFYDGFAFKVDPVSGEVLYFTYVGGRGGDNVLGSSVSESGVLCLVGLTSSTEFPRTSGPAPSGGAELAFVVRFGAPRIVEASVDGKHLVVSGVDFDEGAELFVNGEPVKTKGSGENPRTLIGKKAAKRISRGAEGRLRVRNSDGTLSKEFSFTRSLL